MIIGLSHILVIFIPYSFSLVLVDANSKCLSQILLKEK